MKTEYFSSTHKGTFAGSGAGALQRFLHDYVMLVVPDAVIDSWWVHDRHAGPNDLAPHSTLPRVRDRDETDACIHHYACYVREGNESDIIEVCFVLRNGTFLNLMSGKCWADRQTCLRVADAVERALMAIFTWERIPSVVDMFRKLPRKAAHSVESTLKSEVTVTCTENTVEVRTADGVVLDSYSARSQSAARWVKDYADDWARVLTAAGVRYTVRTAVETALPAAA